MPLVSCVWSAGDADARAYPARHLFRFLANHGMLTLGGSPTWRTVTGGSRTYVEKVVAAIGDVRASARSSRCSATRTASTSAPTTAR